MPRRLVMLMTDKMIPHRRLCVALLAVLGLASAASEVISPLPPMGFNNWARYMDALNETLFVETTDAMLAKGLLKAGYNRINLDDCWSPRERLANGSMTWDTDKFPQGLPWLASYIKAKGFIPGIYTDAGTLSCAGYPGAYGYEEIDAKDFADWGFEFVKLDGCNMPTGTEDEYRKVYGKWHEILSKMDNPMVFSESAPAYFAEAANLTNWYKVMSWVPEFGQLARHSRDTLVWNSTLYWPDITGWDSILFNYGQEVRLGRFQRPGYFNDPDFLNVDHFDYTLDERRSHFALWASFSAPLILSTDVLSLTDEEVKYLTNADIIAVDQDPLVQQASLVSQSVDWDVLTKSLSNGDRLLTILNKGSTAADLTVPWTHIGLVTNTRHTPSKLSVKDLWTGRSETIDLKRSKRFNVKNIPPHGTAIFRISNPALGSSVQTVPTGVIFNTYSLSCLTDSSSRGGLITWTNCTALDSQIWRVREDGTLSSLADEKRCLVEKDGRIQSGDCSKHSKWDYFLSGALINRDSKKCLTETQDAGAFAISDACGYMTNEQVVALPVGVTVKSLADDDSVFDLRMNGA
ncbi:unnamed protein product [Clonostachys rosea]|uniref:Alpha-galactosidase n=1 Tax=Bionectria ochroleuca TaxID=29856 RepID=A0ABY6UFA0_BIOOC|nr:unnamed protein product [Clonostachys rosea]